MKTFKGQWFKGTSCFYRLMLLAIMPVLKVYLLLKQTIAKCLRHKKKSALNVDYEDWSLDVKNDNNLITRFSKIDIT